MTYMARFFPMTRQTPDGGHRWFVCDTLDLDSTNLARPVVDEPCEDRADAQMIADLLNDEKGDPRVTS